MFPEILPYSLNEELLLVMVFLQCGVACFYLRIWILVIYTKLSPLCLSLSAAFLNNPSYNFFCLSGDTFRRCGGAGGSWLRDGHCSSDQCCRKRSWHQRGFPLLQYVRKYPWIAFLVFRGRCLKQSWRQFHLWVILYTVIITLYMLL